MGAAGAVFAVTSHGHDVYSAMTRIAVASLRLTNPSLPLTVACDRETNEEMRRAHDPLLDEVDQWLVVDTPSGDSDFRNRFVKTSLRDVINGPFLFLDSDILARGDVSTILHTDTDLAGARNHSRAEFGEQVSEDDSAALAAMAWEVSHVVYINGGVLFCNATPGAYHFWREWHLRWLLSARAQGSRRDQPALNAALHVTQTTLTVLPDRFNAQFKAAPSAAHGAVVWHYYFSGPNAPSTPYELLVAALMRGAPLKRDTVAGIIRSRHPWRQENTLDGLAVARLVKRNRFDGWESIWLRRQFLPPAPQLVRRALGFARRLGTRLYDRHAR